MSVNWCVHKDNNGCVTLLLYSYSAAHAKTARDDKVTNDVLIYFMSLEISILLTPKP